MSVRTVLKSQSRPNNSLIRCFEDQEERDQDIKPVHSKGEIACALRGQRHELDIGGDAHDW